MAVRKTPETGPIFDNPALRADPTRDDSKIVAMLSRARFNSVIKLVKTAPLDVVLQIRNLTYNTIKRLRLKRNTDLTVKGIPSGSDQVNVKSISDWLNRVTVNDKRAIKQILQIDATAVARGS